LAKLKVAGSAWPSVRFNFLKLNNLPLKATCSAKLETETDFRVSDPH
jgi:hypothetical protein